MAFSQKLCFASDHFLVESLKMTKGITVNVCHIKAQLRSSMQAPALVVVLQTETTHAQMPI